MPFHSLADVRAMLTQLPAPDISALAGAEARNGQLTKPPGALGRLEKLAIWMAGWQGTDRPRASKPQIVIFAGNHGVTAKGVSAFPAEVTVQMVANFAHGGAAINQLAKAFGAKLDVHALDLDRPTADFTEGPAMSEAEVVSALQKGFDAVDPEADLFVAGEMGIGNTTVAAAVHHALYGGDAADWVGPGTGVDADGLARKVGAVARAVARAGGPGLDPLEVLRRVGGREIAAIAGAILAARLQRIPVLLDGYVVTAAAAVLHALDPTSLDHCLAAHRSAEPAHGRVLERIGKRPLLDFGMRLGEASGAALACGIVRNALAIHQGMATFEQAAVSRRT